MGLKFVGGTQPGIKDTPAKRTGEKEQARELYEMAIRAKQR